MREPYIRRLLPLPIYVRYVSLRSRMDQKDQIRKLVKDIRNTGLEDFANDVEQRGILAAFYGEWTKKYNTFCARIKRDKIADRYYAVHKTASGRYQRLYMKHNMDKCFAFLAYRAISLEQDPQSPHFYLSGPVLKKIKKKRGVCLDIGVAEGNFSIDVMDHVSKCYCFEPDDEWVDSLKYTMSPFKNKVKIVKKFVSDGRENDDRYISVDKFFGKNIPTDISIIKMDIEGYELSALRGMRKTLDANPDCLLLVCLYHNKDDEKEISEFFSSIGYNYKIRDGYMFFGSDKDSIVDRMRHGVMEAWKEVEYGREG